MFRRKQGNICLYSAGYSKVFMRDEVPIRFFIQKYLFKFRESLTSLILDQKSEFYWRVRRRLIGFNVIHTAFYTSNQYFAAVIWTVAHLCNRIPIFDTRLKYPVARFSDFFSWSKFKNHALYITNMLPCFLMNPMHRKREPL